MFQINLPSNYIIHIAMIVPEVDRGVVSGQAVVAAPAEPLRVHAQVLAHRQDWER